ncbi:D-glycero-alpha-D-manno-heptose 7-phosphate kinase [subsurface metagenome]
MKTKAPCRISFAGGGTDIQDYCSRYGGCCLAASIARYCYATYGEVNPRPSLMEKEITRYFNADDKLKISSSLPPMSGLGGSASACVAGIKAVAPDLDWRKIAETAYDIERRRMNILGGYQDQIEAAFGGLLYLEFGEGMRARIERLEIPDGLEELLMLVYMGDRKNPGHDVIRDQLRRFNKRALDMTKEIANEMRRCIHNRRLFRDFGRLMEEAWQVKREFSPLVTNPKIDEFHDWALKNGAIAFKLCGAGSGGYALLMEDPERKGMLTRALVNYEPVEFDRKGVRLCK